MRERGSRRDTERVHIERHRDTERERGTGRDTERELGGNTVGEGVCRLSERERERHGERHRERVHVERERLTHTNSYEEIHRERDRERG